MIAIIMGSGDWSDQTVEEIRHTFGNALVKKMYKDFSYKKVLSKGEQEIAGKNIMSKMMSTPQSKRPRTKNLCKR